METELQVHIRNDDETQEYFIGMVDDFFHPDAIVPEEDHLYELYEVETEGRPTLQLHVYWMGKLPELDDRQTLIDDIVMDILIMFDGPPGKYRWN